MASSTLTTLSMEWRDLVFINWAVDPELVRPLVPAGTMLDLWDGRPTSS